MGSQLGSSVAIEIFVPYNFFDSSVGYDFVEVD
jgi:hypothetical protein